MLLWIRTLQNFFFTQQIGRCSQKWNAFLASSLTWHRSDAYFRLSGSRTVYLDSSDEVRNSLVIVDEILIFSRINYRITSVVQMISRKADFYSGAHQYIVSCLTYEYRLESLLRNLLSLSDRLRCSFHKRFLDWNSNVVADHNESI